MAKYRNASMISSILTPAPARSPRQCASRRSRLSNTTFTAHPQSADRLNTRRSMRALCLWIQQSCHQLIHDDNAPPTPALAVTPATIRRQLDNLNFKEAADRRPRPQHPHVHLRGVKAQQTPRPTRQTPVTRPGPHTTSFARVADGPFAMVVCGALPTLHLVARWLRSAAGSIKSKVKPNTSSKSAPRAPPDAAPTELGDMAFMTASTKTTIERGALARSESAGHLEEEALPENGVRVDVVYNVRRDTRTNSECSKRRRWSGWGYEGRRFGNDKPVA